jgi:hypothetical protein
MIRRSPNGPLCPHCGQLNPAALIDPLQVSDSLHGRDDEPAKLFECIHCASPFSFFMERLPFYCTEDANTPRCNCSIHNGTGGGE